MRAARGSCRAMNPVDKLTGCSYGIGALWGSVWSNNTRFLARLAISYLRVCVDHQHLLRSHWRFFFLYARTAAPPGPSTTKAPARHPFGSPLASSRRPTFFHRRASTKGDRNCRQCALVRILAPARSRAGHDCTKMQLSFKPLPAPANRMRLPVAI